MLKLKRNIGEEILIGDDVRIRVVSADMGKTILAIYAPDGVSVDRREVRTAKDAGSEFRPREFPKKETTADRIEWIRAERKRLGEELNQLLTIGNR